jgi:hypothetical protein
MLDGTNGSLIMRTGNGPQPDTSATNASSLMSFFLRPHDRYPRGDGNQGRLLQAVAGREQGALLAVGGGGAWPKHAVDVAERAVLAHKLNVAAWRR